MSGALQYSQPITLKHVERPNQGGITSVILTAERSLLGK